MKKHGIIEEIIIRIIEIIITNNNIISFFQYLFEIKIN